MLTVSRPQAAYLHRGRRAPDRTVERSAGGQAEHGGGRRRFGLTRHSAVLAVVLPLLLHLAGALWIALSVPFPSPIDELQHLSFVRTMKAEPSLFPDHAGLRLLGPDAARFSSEPNYLNHPSAYYLALATSDDPGRAPSTNVLRLRLINVAMSTAALALILLAGCAALPDTATRFVFGVTLVLFPKTSVVAGMINNDNLGLLAGAAVFAGLLGMLRNANAPGAILTGLGLALAGWTKLTLLVMLGFAAAFGLLFALLRRPRLTTGQFAVAGSLAALGAIPTFINLLLFGRLLYVSPTHNFVPVAERPDLSFPEYLLLFLRQLAAKWPGLEPAGPIQLLALAVVLAVIVVVVWRSLTQMRASPVPDAARAVAAAFLLALPASLAVHAVYGYEAFRAIGDLTSAQTRYYSALWPGFALGAAQLFATMPKGRGRALSASFFATLLLLSSAFFASILS